MSGKREREGLVRRGRGLRSVLPIRSRQGQAMRTGVGASERRKERERESMRRREVDGDVYSQSLSQRQRAWSYQNSTGRSWSEVSFGVWARQHVGF